MSKRARRRGFGRFNDAPTISGAWIGVVELFGFERETSTYENH
jgi:hypothetical protein